MQWETNENAKQEEKRQNEGLDRACTIRTSVHTDTDTHWHRSLLPWSTKANRFIAQSVWRWPLEVNFLEQVSSCQSKTGNERTTIVRSIVGRAELRRTLWMCGITPPPAMVALISVSNSSSPRIANCKWRGLIRFTFKSFDALPWNGRKKNRSKHRSLGKFTYQLIRALQQLNIPKWQPCTPQLLHRHVHVKLCVILNDGEDDLIVGTGEGELNNVGGSIELTDWKL